MCSNEPRAVVSVLVVALAVFAVEQYWLSDRIGVWSEEVSTFPQGPNRAAIARAPDGAPEVVSCEGDARLRVSSFRPVLSLCALDDTWPILGSAYYAGWPYWPAAALMTRDVFVRRKLGIALGILTLLLGFVTVRRLSDGRMAVAGVVATVFSSSFLIPHALLVYFETSQLPLVVLAALLLTRTAASESIDTRRAALVGLAFGMSLAVNVKAVFLLAALALLGWRVGRIPRFEGLSKRTFVLGLAAPLLPVLLFAAEDSQAGFSGQFGQRVSHAVTRVTSGTAFLEPLNLLTFWTDLAAYGDRAAGLDDPTRLLPLILPWRRSCGFSYHFLRALRGRDHDRLAATLGALVVVYVVVAALLWNQTPAANYAPLHAVFGFATGTTALALARNASARFSLGPGVATALGALLVIAACAGFAWHTYRRGDPSRLPMGTNAVAQRGVVAHLESHPGGLPLTLTYNLAGVLDAVSGGAVEATHAEPFLAARCGDLAGRELQDCYRRTLPILVSDLGRVRLVLPVTRALSDEERAGSILPALQSLADAGVITLEREASFSGVDTPPLLALFDVRPAPGVPVPAPEL